MSTHPIHILLVEDNADHVELICQSFATSSDIHLKTASNLREAREYLCEIQPDLIIANRLQTDGKAVELLKDDVNDLSFPMIVMTDQDDENEATEAINAGALDYVVKSPASFKAIPRIVRRALREWENITEIKKAEALTRAQRDLSIELSAISDLNEALDLCMEIIIELSGMDAGGIYLVNDNLGLDLIVHKGLPPVFVESTSHLSADAPQTRLIFKGKPIYSKHMDLNVPINEIRKREGLRAFAVLPILHKDNVIACINIASHKFDDVPLSVRDTLEATATRIGSAIVRLKAQDELSKMEKKYRLLTENLKDVVFTVTMDGKLTYCSPAVKEFGGYDADEELGTFIGKYFARKTELKHALKLMKNMFKGHISENIEFLYQPKDRHPFPVEVTAKPIIKDGKIIAMQCVKRDISKRKHAEDIKDALLDIAQATNIASGLEELIQVIRFQIGRLVDTTNFYVALYDNETNTYTFPYHVDQMDNFDVNVLYNLNGSLTDYVRRTGKSLWCDESILIELQSKNEIHTERHGTDSLIWLGVPLKTARGIIGIIAVQSYERADMYMPQDLELLEFVSDHIAIAIERKRIEKVVHEQEELYRTLFEQANDAFVLENENEDILDVNMRTCEMFGYTREELLSMKTTDLQPNEIQSLSIYSDPDHLIYKPVETIALHRDGSEMTIELSIVPLKAGKETLFMSIIRDITERKRAEAERKKLEGQLLQAQKMESIGRLAGGIAHDFNNSLAVIVGHAEIILLELLKEDSLHGDIIQIIKAGRRSADLTRQLLAFSRKQVLRMKVINLNTLIANIEKMLKRIVMEDIELVTNLHPNIGSIKADPTQIDQVFMNLTVNARDAMPEGGKFTIETRNKIVEEDYIKNHPGAKPGVFIMLMISDTGIGMDDDTQKHIFEPFFTTKEMGRGTGLGLSTVYGIVKQHHGYIWVDSKSGAGTTFEILFPRVDETPDKSEEFSHEQIKQGKGETVLIVEDDKNVRKLACKILEMNKYRVLEVGTPHEALSLAKNHKAPIHILLTDVIMPQMDGKELYRKLVIERPDIKVLYMSGHTDTVMGHRSILSSDDPFLRKPFGLKGILDKVREVLEK